MEGSTLLTTSSSLSNCATIVGDGFMDKEVFLNVYDLTPFNSYSIWFGFGIFHTGIEVYGMEYGFGAHDYSISGVFEVEPRSCPGFIYRCSISLGHTDMSASEFREFIESIASDYHGDTYHLISKNCNNFTDDISHRLNCKGIPGWVNRLAKIGSLCSCLLPDSLESTTVKQLTEYYAYDEESDSGSTSSSESEEADQKVFLSQTSQTSQTEVGFIKEVAK
ncbi:deSI-like protein At4g17486 [Bidens hawaiensis]|uniref:deSI-like protein At4g17486 n=1 Tax=Bidens hawaiensis TaxID=980011 RepID=UPI004049ACA1